VVPHFLFQNLFFDFLIYLINFKYKLIWQY